MNGPLGGGGWREGNLQEERRRRILRWTGGGGVANETNWGNPRVRVPGGICKERV